MISLLAVFIALCGAAFGGELRAGFAAADITPPLGLEMAGFGPYLERKATGVHDPLMARAVVLETGGKRMAIVGCDLAGVTLEMTTKVRKQVEGLTGIPAARIMVTATHTHSGPAVPHWIGWGERDEKYLSDLHLKLAAAVIDAARKLQPVTLAYGEAPVEGVARNREYKDGPIDKNVRVLKFLRGDGRLAGFIAHYSVHPVVMCEQTRLITSDLVGVATGKVLQDHAGAVGIFLQGSCGDINSLYAHLPQDVALVRLEELSSLLAGDIREALKRSAPVSVDRIDMRTRRISLPLVPTDRALMLHRMQISERLLKRTDLPLEVQRQLRFLRDTSRAVFERYRREPLTERATEIQAARVQDVLLVANPGETFITFAGQTAELLPGYKVLVTGYANDYVGLGDASANYVLTGANLAKDSTDQPGVVEAFGKKIKVPPDNRKTEQVYRISGRYALVLPEDYSDIIAFMQQPAKTVALTVDAPETLVFSSSPPADVQTPRRWEYHRVFIPGQHLRLRWFPRRAQPAAGGQESEAT